MKDKIFLHYYVSSRQNDSLGLEINLFSACKMYFFVATEPLGSILFGADNLSKIYICRLHVFSIYGIYSKTLV
jgi:hypothetical protein